MFGWKAGAWIRSCTCSAAFRAAARLRRERREPETCATTLASSDDGRGVSLSCWALLGLSALAGRLPASLVALPTSLPLPQAVVFVPRLLPLHLLLSLLALLLLHLACVSVALVVGRVGGTRVPDIPTRPDVFCRGTKRSNALSRVAQALRSMWNMVVSPGIRRAIGFGETNDF